MMQQSDEHKLKGARKLGERAMNIKFVNWPKGCRKKGSASAVRCLGGTKAGKAALDEGHGFTRAVKFLELRSRACDFFDLSVFLHTQPDAFNPTTKSSS
jgi:hypothetical protein